MIIFTNYKKIYTVLGVFMLLLTILYIASVIYRKNQDRTNTTVNTTEGTGKLSLEDVDFVKFLLGKTESFINAIPSSASDIKKDPVFQNVSSESVKMISTEISSRKDSANIEYGAIDLSGKIYVNITNETTKISRLYEFNYKEVDDGVWKLIDIKRVK